MKFTEHGWKSSDGRIMTPAAGSAKEAGCTCDPRQNHLGLGEPIGDGTVKFYPNRECRVHWNWPWGDAK